MENKSEFLDILKLAVIDDVALVKVIDKIMNLINRYSKNKRHNWWRFKEWINNIFNRINTR